MISEGGELLLTHQHPLAVDGQDRLSASDLGIATVAYVDEVRAVAGDRLFVARKDPQRAAGAGVCAALFDPALTTAANTLIGVTARLGVPIDVTPGDPGWSSFLDTVDALQALEVADLANLGCLTVVDAVRVPVALPALPPPHEKAHEVSRLMLEAGFPRSPRPSGRPTPVQGVGHNGPASLGTTLPRTLPTR